MTDPQVEGSRTKTGQTGGANTRKCIWKGLLASAGVLTIVVLTAACEGGGDDPEPTLTATPVLPATPESTPTTPGTMPTSTPSTEASPAAGEVLYESDMAHLGGAWSGAVVLGTDVIMDNPDAYWETDIRLVTEALADARACLMARLQEDRLDDAFYFFCLHGDGTTEAGFQHTDGEVDVLLPREPREAGSDPSQWTTLSMVALGDDFWFLINDQLVGTVHHSGTTDGAVGVSVEDESDEGAQFEFTNFVVRALE